ncbi:MAG: TetR/AcrR family transcriptional regulator [Candidatus Atribacteria bacterium]|jgi:AcrR family transcriptional regulator|nr:TetR/AcrR family transcriptional regulator [Candidatus Atribacteria bacterium]
MGKFIKKPREERIEEILNAATEVFLKKGYHNTTMEDIINATTLSKGGFYYYFKSTKEIFFRVLDRTSNIDIVENIDKNNPKKEIINEICEKLAQTMLERFDERTLYMMSITEFINDPDFRKYHAKMEERYLRMMEKSMLEKLPDIDPVILGEKLKFMVSIYNALAFYCYMYQEEDLYERNIDQIKNIFVQILSGI